MKVSGGLSGFARRTASYAIVSHFIQIDIHWHSGTLNTYKIDCLPFVCCSVLFYVYIVCTYACFVEPTMCSIAVSNTFFFGTHFFSRKDCWCSSNTITVEHITLSHFSCFFVCLYIHLMLKIVSEICFELANWYLTAAAEFTKTSTVQITVKLLFTICLIFFEASSKPNHFVYNHQQYIYVCTLLSSNHWPPNQYAYLEIKQQKKNVSRPSTATYLSTVHCIHFI